MNGVEMKAEVNTEPSNANVQANEKRGFDLPLFELPKMAMPGIFSGIAEQSVVRAKENCEKIQAASLEMTEILRETYSTNARSAVDYGAKVIEMSSVNANSAFDFLTDLMGTKSLSEVISLSTAHGRKNFEAASVQNKALWELAQKAATETAEPIKRSFGKILQKAI